MKETLTTSSCLLMVMKFGMETLKSTTFRSCSFCLLIVAYVKKLGLKQIFSGGGNSHVVT